MLLLMNQRETERILLFRLRNSTATANSFVLIDKGNYFINDNNILRRNGLHHPLKYEIVLYNKIVVIGNPSIVNSSVFINGEAYLFENKIVVEDLRINIAFS